MHGGEFVRLDRFGEAFEFQIGQRFRFDQIAQFFASGFADDHFHAAGLAAQPRSEVDPLAEHGVVQAVARTHATRDGLAGIRDTVATLATAEGLLAHRDAVTRRFELDRADRSGR